MEEEETRIIKVFGYARKSPDDKDDTRTSIENQIKLIKRTAEENSWNLIKIFVDESVSGSDRDRKEFVKMISELYPSDVEILLVKEQDRFARDSSFFRDTLVDFEAYKKKLYSCMRNKFISHDDLGDMVHAMIDDNYVLDQRKKALVSLNQKKDECKPIGNPIFGYKYNYKFNPNGDKVPINKTLEINEWIKIKKDAEIVLGVLSEYTQSVDYKATMQKYKINKSKYYRIINNAKNGLYSGFIAYQRKIKDSNKNIVRVEEIKYKGNHDPIISEELCQKVQFK